MKRTDRWGAGVLAALAATLAVEAAGAPELAAQADRYAFLSAPEVRTSEVLRRDGYAVVVDLDENQLHFIRGRSVLWSAPVATGMGLRLETGDRKWEFSTPTGVYQVMQKAEKPTWYAPDWYFLENNLPVPPRNDPRRRFPGGLGAAAVYIGHGLAIHGTDKPDLLGQRVSHGCIRLSNDDAQRLFHNVQIGTQVIIVGSPGEEAAGRLIPGQVPGTGPVDARTERLRRQVKSERDGRLERLGRLEVDSLAERLAGSLEDRRDASRWIDYAAELVRRSVDGEPAAARALLAAREKARAGRVRAEYLTFLMDALDRAPMQTVEALGRLPVRARERAAVELVEAAIGLYDGSPDDQVAPWPTRRLPPGLDGRALSGAETLAAAERSSPRRATETVAGVGVRD
jgi:lipoprotein-anchoring transpeptidase ErfK/SrfK